MKRATPEELIAEIQTHKARKQDIKDNIALLKSKLHCFPLLQELEESKDTTTIYVTSWDHFEEMEPYLPPGIMFENSLDHPLHIGRAFERRNGNVHWNEWDDTDDMPHVGLCVNYYKPLSKEIENQFRLKMEVQWIPDDSDSPEEDQWDSGKRVCGTFFKRVGLIGHKDIIATFMKKFAFNY